MKNRNERTTEGKNEIKKKIVNDKAHTQQIQKKLTCFVFVVFTCVCFSLSCLAKKLLSVYNILVLTRANSLLCDDKFCYFIIIIYCWFVLFNIRFACFCVCVIFFFRIYIFLYVSIYNCHFFRYSLN